MGISDGDLNRVRAAKRIQADTALHIVDDESGPGVPLGEEVIDSQGTNPGSESLVEPEVVPPLHGNQVSEPLMGNLVGNGDGDLLLEAQVRSLLVEEKGDSAVGDKTPVFHGASIKVRDGKVVQLGEGVCGSEDFGKVLEDLGGDLEGEATLLLQAGKGVDTASDGLLQLGGSGLDVLELSDSPSNQLFMEGKIHGISLRSK